MAVATEDVATALTAAVTAALTPAPPTVTVTQEMLGKVFGQSMIAAGYDLNGTKSDIFRATVQKALFPAAEEQAAQETQQAT